MDTTTATTTISDTQAPTVRELALFLAKYCGRLMGAGATCIRLEKNVDRIAARYGMHAEITIMPRHVHLSLWDTDSADCVTAIESVAKCPISFNVNTRLSELSWEIADGKTSFDEARSTLAGIDSFDRQSEWLLLCLVPAANAAFCGLFGGDAIAMLIVAIATLAGYYLKQTMLHRGIDLRVTVFACAFVSAVLGATDILFSFGDTPAIALGTSVLYLVPGIPFLNSFSDVLYRHYICALGRFADALVLTCCLSAGLCVAMLLMNTGMF